MIVLTLKSSAETASFGSVIDLQFVLPENLVGKNADAIGDMPLDGSITGEQSIGRTNPIRIKNRFDIQIHGGDSNATESVSDELSGCVVVIDRTTISGVEFQNVGRKMKFGTLVLLGDGGLCCGMELQGGKVIVVGSVGVGSACGMTGGVLTIFGNAADQFAGPMPGKRSGLSGGEIIVLGNVGIRAFERMRRGTVLVGGDMGEQGCSYLIAGTVVCLGSVGKQLGIGMKRGSILLRNEPCSDCEERFSPSRSFELSFLPLIWKHLRNVISSTNVLLNHVSYSLGIKPFEFQCDLPSTRWVERRIGDLAHSGSGEILVLKHTSSRANER